MSMIELEGRRSPSTSGAVNAFDTDAIVATFARGRLCQRQPPRDCGYRCDPAVGGERNRRGQGYA